MFLTIYKLSFHFINVSYTYSSRKEESDNPVRMGYISHYIFLMKVF